MAPQRAAVVGNGGRFGCRPSVAIMDATSSESYFGSVEAEPIVMDAY